MQNDKLERKWTVLLISVQYGKVIAEYCEKNGVRRLDARPWDTSLNRAITCIWRADS